MPSFASFTQDPILNTYDETVGIIRETCIPDENTDSLVAVSVVSPGRARSKCNGNPKYFYVDTHSLRRTGVRPTVHPFSDTRTVPAALSLRINYEGLIYYYYIQRKRGYVFAQVLVRR